MAAGDMETGSGKATALSEPLLVESSCSSYEYIFAIRLPEEASKKKKEIEAFSKYMAGRGITPTALLKPMMKFSDGCCDIDCGEDLAGTLNAFFGVLYSFFDTLAASHDATIDVLKFGSIEMNKVFVCTRMSPKLAETLADMSEYPVQLSVKGVMDLGIKISDPTGLVPAFVKYDKDQKEKELLKTFGSEGTVLRHIDRMRLMYDKITDHFDIYELMKVFAPLNITLKLFECHDVNEIEKLRKNWATWLYFFHWSIPCDDIREYFGEGVTLYFMFANTVKNALFVLFCLALPFDIYIQKSGNDNARAFFTIVVMIWITLLVKYWRRLESYYANIWGTDFRHTSMTVKEAVNPEFEAEPQPSDIDENILELRADLKKQRIGHAISYGTTFCFMLLVLLSVAYLRTHASSTTPADVAWAGRELAIMIKVFDIIWQQLCLPLTEKEQHPYLRTREQSYGMKYFFFLFFNTFNGFLWIAHVDSMGISAHASPEEQNTALAGIHSVLRSTIISAFPLMIVFTGVGMLVPWLQIKYKYYKQVGDLKAKQADHFYEISSFEQQTKMFEYSGDEQSSDFLQVLMPLAFVGMFAVSAPSVIVALAWFAIALQCRVDSMRVTMLYQRPYPHRVQDIGVWNAALKFIVFMSILNNCALLVSNYHISATLLHASWANEWYGRAFVFFVVFNVSWGFVSLFNYLVDDVYASTQRETRRQKHQRAKLFESETTEFNEKILVKGHPRWQESAFHKIEKLMPEDPRYVKPISF